MIPTALKTYLNYISSGNTATLLQTLHLLASGDTTAVLRQIRAEHVGNFDKSLNGANGAIPIGCRAAELGVATQFALRVTNF